MRFSRGVSATPVDHALDELATAVDHLLKAVGDGGLDHYDARDLMKFIEDMDRQRNRLAVVDHRALAEAGQRRLADTFSFRSLSALLTSRLRISGGEAVRRVRAAEACAPRNAASGAAESPTRPMLAAAQTVGEIGAEQTAVIERTLSDIDRPYVDPAAVRGVEMRLVAEATLSGPKELRQLADRLTATVQPTQATDRDRVNHDRRYLRLSDTADGMVAIEGRLTAGLGAQVRALLSPLARPAQTIVPGPRGGDQVVPDPRHYGQRIHDALETATAMLLRSGGLPTTGGTPATVVVTIDHQSLLDATGTGVTSDGTVLSVRELLRIATEAEVIPAVLSSGGAVLDLGRSRRIASRAQSLALIARDRGCSFPGCTAPPEWADRHHILDWSKGGMTDLDNLTLLCRFHHTHFEQQGWRCRLNDQRLPEWIPPRRLDRDQRPIMNRRISRRC